MFDFTAALTQLTAFITTALGIIDATTALGGVVLIAFMFRPTMGFLRRLKGVIPS